MRFEKALKAMREGKKVRCGYYTYKIEGNILKSKRDGSNTWFGGTMAFDVMSEKWEIVDDTN